MSWIASYLTRRFNALGLDLVRLDVQRAASERFDALSRELRDAQLEIRRLRDGIATLMTFRAHEAEEAAQSAVSAPTKAKLTPGGSPAIPICHVSDHDGIVAGFADHEAVLVRDAIPVDWAAGYLDRIKHYFACVENACGVEPITATARGLVESFRRQSGLGLSSRYAEVFPIPAGIRNIFNPLKASGIVDCARRFYGSELFFMPDYSSVRRQSPEESAKALTWHQDGAAVGNSSEDQLGLVFWVPLTPVDAETPGLEIVARPAGALYPHVGTASGYNEIADNARVAKEFADSIVRVPPMAVGDILIISFNTIHRTYLAPGMTRTRYSLDVRAVPLRHVPWQYRGWLVIP